MPGDEKYTQDKILVTGNFSIVLYFLIIYLLNYFKFSSPAFDFIHELLSISILLAAFIFFVLGILRLIKSRPTPLFIISFILLTITILLITYSFFSG